MNSKLCVAFGDLEHPSAWVSEVPEEMVPLLGMRTQLRMHVENAEGEDDDYEIVGQVVYMEDDEEDGSTLAFIYGGEEEPEEIIQLILETNGWVRLDDEEAFGIMEIVQVAPPTAALHDVLLIAGDLNKLDENGEPVFEVWNRIFEPEDPILPMFGQRVRIDILNSIKDETVEEDVLGEPGEPYEVVDLDAPGTLEDGVPGLVIHSARSEPGIAQMAFWVKSLDSFDRLSMIASDWEKIDISDIDDDGSFKLLTRIDLALRTHLELRYDEEGFPYLYDFFIDKAEEVPEEDYEILPNMLIDHCKFAKEMAGVENVENMIAGWDDTKPPAEEE